MTALTILKLRIGDSVRDEHGTLGEVVYFTCDHVVIRWNAVSVEAGVMRASDTRYTDEDLKAYGIEQVIQLDGSHK